MLSLRMVVVPRASAWGISASPHSRSMSSRIVEGETLRAATLVFMNHLFGADGVGKQRCSLGGEAIQSVAIGGRSVTARTPDVSISRDLFGVPRSRSRPGRAP